MSMIGNVRRTPDAKLRSLLDDPESIVDYLDPDSEVEGFRMEVDLDKAWHGIHYLLTRTAWEGDEPLDFLVRGGEEVGEVDVGYGPARAFTSGEVKAIWSALRPLTGDVLRSRFDPEDMTRLEIYPDVIWKRDPAEDDALGYVLEFYETLRTLVADAATNGDGLLIWLN